MKPEETYNGWKNYETWNVSLWIQNDEGLYSEARTCKTYTEFSRVMRETFESIETPDGVAWNDSGLDIDALNELLGDL